MKLRDKIHKFLCYLYHDKKWEYNLNISWIFIIIDSIGISFPYKCDEIIWLWPWRRKNSETKFHKSNKYVSVCSEGYFNSLKEIDKFWIEFDEALKGKGTINVEEFNIDDKNDK